MSCQRIAVSVGRRRVSAQPRWLHPGSWWLWALGLATAASRTTNPLLLALIIAVAGVVVAARRPNAPWARSYSSFLRLGLFIIAFRVLFGALFGASMGSTVLITLPSAALPAWAEGVRLGGDVTLETLVLAAYEGLRLATMLACLGAANSLASPSRLLKSLPGALYEAGIAVVVTLTFAPQVVADVSRVQTARRLRGRPDRGVRAIAGAAMPVFEGGLERAITLAAAMDSRGYGRRDSSLTRTRHLGSAFVLSGLVGICIGIYGLLDADTPAWLGLPIAALGVALGGVGLHLAGRHVTRTRYRPDVWALPEWLVAISGLVPAAALIYASAQGLISLDPSVVPLVWPALPVVPTLAILVALAPAIIAPPLPRSATIDVRTTVDVPTTIDDSPPVLVAPDDAIPLAGVR